MPTPKHPSNEGHELSAFRMPTELRKRAKAKAQREDITFSQLVRRAIRRELGVREGAAR